MTFAKSVKAVVSKHIDKVKSAYDDRLKEAEQRAKLDMAKAKTRQERELAILRLKREKAKLAQDLAEAKLATQQAVKAAERARIEAGDLTFSERLSGYGKQFTRSAQSAYAAYTKPAPRKTVKRKPAVKKAVAKKTTTRKPVKKAPAKRR